MSTEIEKEVEKNEAEVKQKSPAKKVLGIIVNVLLWIFVAFCALTTVLAFAQTSSSYNVPSIGDVTILTVKTDSMKPVFEAGDIIIAKKVDDQDAENLQVDDIITFAMSDVDGDGYRDLNTHRIVEVIKDESGKVTSYRTKGDNNAIEDADTVNTGAVVCKYTGTRIQKLGHVLGFLQTPTGFLVVIVIPLVLFFVFELISFIRKVLQMKNAGKKQITVAEEELIRQRAVEEYIKAQQAKEQAEKAAANVQTETVEAVETVKKEVSETAESVTESVTPEKAE